MAHNMEHNKASLQLVKRLDCGFSDVSGISTVARNCLSPEPHCQGGGAKAVGPRRATIHFSSMSQFSLLQVDVEVEEPEMLENPTQSFEIHYHLEEHTAFGHDNILYDIDMI